MGIKLDCCACTATQSMIPARIPKFPPVLRFVGLILAISSVIGFITAFVAAYFRKAMEFDAALIIGSCSLAGGVIGWLLCIKKKVYPCRTCGCNIKRAWSQTLPKLQWIRFWNQRGSNNMGADSITEWALLWFVGRNHRHGGNLRIYPSAGWYL